MYADRNLDYMACVYKAVPSVFLCLLVPKHATCDCQASDMAFWVLLSSRW